MAYASIDDDDGRHTVEKEPLLRPDGIAPVIDEDLECKLSDSTQSWIESQSLLKREAADYNHNQPYEHRRRSNPRANRSCANSIWRTVLLTIGLSSLLSSFVIWTIVLGNLQQRLEPSSAFRQHKLSRNPAVLISARNGAVATEHETCSKLGVNVLKVGGNAVDAAVASTFCIGVVNPFSSGIGGGGFMTVRIPKSPSGSSSNSSSSDVWTIDFRETAPARSSKSMFADDPKKAKYGGLSVGVPGEVRGLAEAHSRWGALPWKRLLEPSIKLAEGFPVGRELGKRLPTFANLIFGDQVWRDIFAPGSKILEEGQILRRTNYSRTLATIAKLGADAFYKGNIADAIISTVQATGGIMTHQDLEAYEVIVQPALAGTYRDKKVYTTHAPTSGPVLLHILNLLEHHDLSSEGRTGLNTHRMIEAIKFGFAARTKISDPQFINDTSRIDEIATKQFGNVISANVTDDTTHTVDYYHPVFDTPIDHGTSHNAAVDRYGMVASITSSVNIPFGSQVMDCTTGILLNDEMDDFSTPGTPNAFGLWPSPYNYPEPRKRPLSSIAPTIIENSDGTFYLTLGASGGSKIFPALLQVILGVYEWGLDVSQAIEWGRVHDQLYPPYVGADNILSSEIIEALRVRGHNITVLDINRPAADVQAIVKKGGMLYAASDSRKNGISAGY